MIFVKYNPRVVAEPVKRQETPVSLGPLLLQHYTHRANEIKSGVVGATKVELLSAEVLGQETHMEFEIVIEGETEELVYDFARSLVKREELDVFEVTFVTIE